MTKSILLVGVGGQGTILASKLLTLGLMEAGYDIKMSEIHGMSQRGGSVSSQVRYSKEKVYSPVIEIGGADMIVSFEKMEALRYLKYLKLDGKIVANNYRMDSVSTLVGNFEYKEKEIDEKCRRIRKFKSNECYIIRFFSQINELRAYQLGIYNKKKCKRKIY